MDKRTIMIRDIVWHFMLIKHFLLFKQWGEEGVYLRQNLTM
jgi:hypothetical protein